MSKLIPSRNTIERLQMGLPLTGSYLQERLTAMYTELADIGCATEQLKTCDDVLRLSRELREFEQMFFAVQRDVLARGDAL